MQWNGIKREVTKKLKINEQSEWRHKNVTISREENKKLYTNLRFI
jgi:hypothetical protein